VGVTVHGLMPDITPAGETGRTAAPALGISFGDDVLTAGQVGDAVLHLSGVRAPGSGGGRALLLCGHLDNWFASPGAPRHGDEESAQRAAAECSANAASPSGSGSQ
jgi:hypothetical protein